MKTSLRRLLTGVIDYAGLFPPAKLEMELALANYLRYRAGAESWLVSRFVCPASRLHELYEVEEPIEVTVVGSANKDRSSWEAALEQDARWMNDFQERSRATIGAYEIRIPSHEEIGGCIRDLRGFQDVDVFVELPWSEGISESLHALAGSEWLAAKARTGGVTAEAFPSCEDLAGFLHLALSLDLDFKLTAGLHHPFRHHSADVGAHMHGFINLLCAATLVLSEDISRATVADVLEAQAPSSFAFGEDGIEWLPGAARRRPLPPTRDDGRLSQRSAGGAALGFEDGTPSGFDNQAGPTADASTLRANLQAITEMRERLIGFGSCSVEEPLQDLASEGLLGE